jgi:hypothetical protein
MIIICYLIFPLLVGYLATLLVIIGATFAETNHINQFGPRASYPMTEKIRAKRLTNQTLRNIWRDRHKAIHYRNNQ